MWRCCLQAPHSRRLLLQTWRRPAAVLPPRQTTQKGAERGEEEAARNSPWTRFKNFVKIKTTSSSLTCPLDILRAIFGDVYASSCARNGEPTCQTKVDFTPFLRGCESPRLIRNNGTDWTDSRATRWQSWLWWKHVQATVEQKHRGCRGLSLSRGKKTTFSTLPHR